MLQRTLLLSALLMVHLSATSCTAWQQNHPPKSSTSEVPDDLAEEEPFTESHRASVVAPDLSSAPPEVAGRLRYELTVKFRDELQVRTTENGSIFSETGGDLTAVEVLIRDFELTFSPAIDLPPGVLQRLQDRGREQSGISQPDLGSILKVHVKAVDPSELETARRAFETVGTALQELPEVQHVEIRASGVPPPRGLPVKKPDPNQEP